MDTKIEVFTSELKMLERYPHGEICENRPPLCVGNLVTEASIKAMFSRSKRVYASNFKKILIVEHEVHTHLVHEYYLFKVTGDLYYVSSSHSYDTQVEQKGGCL